MCSNYLAVTRRDRLLTFFGVDCQPKDESRHEVFPLGTAPFLRLTVEGEEGGIPALIAEDGIFGLLPNFATEMKYGRRTYNARSETVNKLPSFRPAWRAGHRCVIPAESVFEPNYETGKAVRWRIFQDGDIPFGIAGIYWRWKRPSGELHYTFAMLTVNADTHPFYKRFHKPDDEKRMPSFLNRDEYLPWLTAPLANAPAFFKRHPGPFLGEPAALVRAHELVVNPPAKDEVQPKRLKLLPPPAPPAQGDLF